MGNHRLKEWLDIRIFLGIFAFFGTVSCAKVHYITPHNGSLAGDTILTVYGEGFAADNFNQNEDSNYGNNVYLVTESGLQVTCDVVLYGSTEKRIVCNTPANMPSEDHFVKVTVNGAAIDESDLCGGLPMSSNCAYKPSSTYTPTISTLAPQSGLPGAFVTLSGRISTNLYGENINASTLGHYPALRTVNVGLNECDLKNGEELYGLSVYCYVTSCSYGSIKCKTRTASAGFFNASFYVESPFGRSLASDDVYRVSSTDIIYMYQIYSDITRVSPSKGSKEGGLTLTIYGKYFDDTTPVAHVGDTKCNISKVVFNEYIECTVAPDPHHSTYQFAGNRGVMFESWNVTSLSVGNVDEILSMANTDPGYNMTWLDDAYYSSYHPGENYAYKMTTFFTPSHDGEYSLQIKSDYTSNLYVDRVEIEKFYVCRYCSNSYRNRMNLTASNRYLLEVVTYGFSSSFIEVSAKFYNSHLTGAWTKKAEQEEQKIRVTSTVVPDVQELTFKGFYNSTLFDRQRTNEVQVVDITSRGLFRLGLYGIYTEILSVLADESVIQRTFNAIPVFAPGEHVTVVRNPSSSTYVSYTFTFESTLEDFPAIELKAVEDNQNLSYNVTQLAQGVPDKEHVRLIFDGVVSEPFSVLSLDEEKLETILEGMFHAKCPDEFSGEEHAFLYESFEKSSRTFQGTITKETEPFCGRFSLKNPTRIYDKYYYYWQDTQNEGVSMSRYSQICFAYKGLIQNNIWLYYQYRDGKNARVYNTTKFEFTFKRDSKTRSTTWYYTCFDMMSHMLNTHPGATNFQLHEAWIKRSVWDSDMYVDALVIGGRQTIMDFDDVNLRRRPAAMPNGAIIDKATVQRNTADKFTVTLATLDCGHQFPVICLGNSQVTSGSVSYPSDAAEFELSGLETRGLSVRRLSYASPPVRGTIDIEFKGNTKTDLSISSSDKLFGKDLESLQGTGDLSVLKEGDCANFDYDIIFMNLPGDQPELKITYTNLTSIDAKVSVTTENDGGLLFLPLSGDMLSTVHDKPQVSLYSNDVPTMCSGDCSFQWSDEVTPKITAVSPTVGGSSKTSILVSGSGFETEPSRNTVMIGGTECVITSSAADSISCDVGNGPLGDHKVMVSVTGKGYAKHVGSDVTFTYTADITSISPSAGSLGGGINLTVSGYGFSEKAIVFVGEGICSLLDIKPNFIICSIPPSESAGTAGVNLSLGPKNYTFTGFTYDIALTPVVHSIIPLTVGVAGGTITISGSNFGQSGTVYVGDVTGEIITYTENLVILNVFGLAPGIHEVKVVGLTGNAILRDSHTKKRSVDIANVPVINVELSVTNVFPLVGSVKGGTRLTISGIGFGDDSGIVEVVVGNVACRIESVTNTEIVCLIADTEEVHVVTNLGTHRAYGVYYAFDKPHLTVERGDIVRWTWTTPDFVNDIKHAIIEVEYLLSTVAKAGGFSSGTPSRNGNFQYQFNEPGTFYVWSGYVDIYGLKNYAGQIDVVHKLSSLDKVTVRVNGIESTYNTEGSSEPVDLSSCQSLTSAIKDCSDVVLTFGNANQFNFAFWTCSTPKIQEVFPNRGTAKTVINISGNGFSTVDCQNEIKFSNYTCIVLSSTESTITCTIDKSDQPVLGVYHPISMRVRNRGKALNEIAFHEHRSFGMIPNIEHLSPVEGSLAGGTRLTITGFGYGESIFVLVGNLPCNVIETSYNQIICETSSSISSKEVDVVVHVMVKGMPQAAVCETNNQRCKFTYSTLVTPIIDSIDIESVSNATDFTIIGTKFGNDTSKLEVYIGSEPASLIFSNDTHLVAMIQNVPVGKNVVLVRHKENGKAYGDIEVSGIPVIFSLVPSAGSTYGGTEITLTGNGFVEGDTMVKIGDNNCSITYVSLSKLVCTTPGGSPGFASVFVISNSIAYQPESFQYSASRTPLVSSISPQFGLPGEMLNISGTNLEGDTVVVMLDDIICPVMSSSFSLIQCIVGVHSTGLASVRVHVSSLGQSNTDISFKYMLNITRIYPARGSIAGKQTVTLTGQGFSDEMVAKICYSDCILQTSNATSFICKTPSYSGTEMSCDVEVSLNGLKNILSDAYIFDEALTPTVTSVIPKRGGTGGGTKLTVLGSGFGTNPSDINVRIAGSICGITKATDTQIICETESHSGSIKAKVEVEVSGNGQAKEENDGDSDFFYIDVWSSNFTWGGATPPLKGEFVVVPANQTLLLDTDTPVLSFLLIKGGQLIFDEKDIELQANIIMVTDGGLLQVGTEVQPFQHKAIITLHGDQKSKELPVYGTKVIAVRDGTLELHGKEIPLTWTKLASTATVGSTTLELVDQVEWNVGDDIIIATTGHYRSQRENEKRTISAISANKTSLTINSPLNASHLGVKETFDGTLVELRCEVGLLTRNVVVRGNRDQQWTEGIDPCPDGFDTSQFAKQTCFVGRYGEEAGGSQFGGTILVHASVPDTHAAVARLSYIEVTFAGQAYRMGMNPIHFFLNGDMSTSYVRGLSIHETFNRALSIHGVHNTVVEKNVLYNVMGSAVILEDGVETGNTLLENLVVFVREISTLLNTDITPAAFLITNPDNTVISNGAAGGSHFGYWYRLNDHPEGPSYTTSIYPDSVPLGVFKNNTAHSFGWYGLWIFPNYHPYRRGYCCRCDGVEPAIFHSMTAWNNQKGAEAVNIGTVQFEEFLLLQNKLAGLEIRKVFNYETPLYTDSSPMVRDSLVVGTTTLAYDNTQGCTDGGIVLPDGSGFRVKNVRFVNFATDCSAFTTTRSIGSCSIFCGGHSYEIEGVLFVNSSNKARFEYEWEAVLFDKDGSLTEKGEGGWKLLPFSNTLPTDCETAEAFSIAIKATMCPPKYKFTQYVIRDPNPYYLRYKPLVIRNKYGNSSISYNNQPLGVAQGWMSLLVDGEMYKFEVENAQQITNISYDAYTSMTEVNGYVIVAMRLQKFPDRVLTNYISISATLDGMDPSSAVHGDWEWNNTEKEIRVLDSWVVVKSGINVLGNLVLRGVLEFAGFNTSVYEISVNNIIIMGGRLIIGWPDAPFLGQADITLRGDHSSPYFEAEGNGPVIGSKAIGVFGGLDLFGRDVGLTWTMLKESASVGARHIFLDRSVAWASGDEIIIGPSHNYPWKSEIIKIMSVSRDGFLLTLNDSLKFNHIVYTESFSNGQSINIATPVGLLTRTIRIIGKKYPKMFDQGYGARVLVGRYITPNQIYTGNARLSNVEFLNTGQEGFSETYDARFSVTYIAVGNVSSVKPSYVSKCAFHHGFNSAIGAFGIGGLNITDNVVHDVVGDAIVTNSNDTTINHNMVSLIKGTASSLLKAGIKAVGAARLILRNNFVTASEGFGYNISPLPCTETSANYTDNMAYSNRIGLTESSESTDSFECAEYSGFKLWNNYEKGVYYHRSSSLRLLNNILIDNKLGIWTGIFGPTALSHKISGKTAEITNSLIIGRSPFSECVHDNVVTERTGNRTGVLFPSFTSGGFASYSAIAGLMKLKNVTFAYFGNSSCGKDYAIATNIGNDDGQHPVEIEKVSLYNVQHDSKAFYHRPNIEKINPSDCVDMDCDGLKKALIKDLDGTFLGHIGAVIPQSEFEWGTNPQRGLGDYRIPKEMVTNPDGTRIPYDEIAPNKGIIRNDNCTYRPSWQAYECREDLNYEMLIIESMDKDTERRRISPVAILGDGYIDLINGPQDHSWCTSYSCRKRISTFMSLVATDKAYLLHFTGTTPFHMRYILLNTETESIKLTVWYSRPNRLDVYVDGKLIMAKNARINSQGFYVIDMQKDDEFEPKLSDPTGTNKMDQERGEHTIIIRGSTPVEVVTQAAIIVSFGLPAMTVEDFFGVNIVENIAGFLNIPLTKVRVMNVVSEKGRSSRRKRNTEGVYVTVEIGDEPSLNMNGTVPDSLMISDLQNVASDIINECQLGNLEILLGVIGNCESIYVPAGNASDSVFVYNTPKPQRLQFAVEIVPDYENVPMKTHPKVQVTDKQSNIVKTLGTQVHPWQLEASIRSGTGHPDAVLTGSPLINASDGWFNFTELVVSHAGFGYILDFHVAYPEAAKNFTLSSSPFDIGWPPLTAHVITKTEGDILPNANFSVGLDLRDSKTGTILENIGWRNHTWYADVDMLGNSEYGELSGEITANFDAVTGRVVFHDLQIGAFGFFYVQFRVYSQPSDFNFTLNEKMIIMNPAHIGMIPEEHYKIQVKFDADYDRVLPSENRENEFEQMILSKFSHTWPNVRIKSGSIEKGSIEVIFEIEGSRSDVNNVANSLCEKISGTADYTFYNYTLSLDNYMEVNDDSSFCQAPETASNPAVVIAIAVSVTFTIVVVIILIIVVWKCCYAEKRKHHDVFPDTNPYLDPDVNRDLAGLFRGYTFTSLKFLPPSSTKIERQPERCVSSPRSILVAPVANQRTDDSTKLTPP